MFPETIETDSLALYQFTEANVDVFELYNLFAECDDSRDVFRYVPQEPYSSVKDAHDKLDRGVYDQIRIGIRLDRRVSCRIEQHLDVQERFDK